MSDVLNPSAEAIATVTIPGGEDTAHCSFYCTFTPRFLEHLTLIAQAKKMAEHPSDHEDDPVFVCGDRLYVVMPYGFSPNRGLSRYCYYQYVLKDGGITIGIQPRECGGVIGEEDDKVQANRPNIRVEIGALPLIVAGSMDCIMPEIEERLQEMGLVIVKNRLGRVDACVDMPFPVSRLQQAVIDRRFITRARYICLNATVVDNDGHAPILSSRFEDPNTLRVDFNGYVCTGFTIGRDKILCRGYDKMEKEKHCEEILQALAQRRCGGTLWPLMTRIEFQLRREALRGMTVIGHKTGIETWQDWCRFKRDIIHYLCTNWLIFTATEFDRIHTERIRQDRTAWHPDWLEVVKACSRAYGESARKVVRLESSIKREAREHIAQSLGCGQSAVLKSGMELSPHDPLWKEKFAAFVYAAIRHHLDDPKHSEAFWRNWNDKALRQECSIPEESVSCLIPVASRGAGVTHNSPLSQAISSMLMTAGAFGPAPSVIS